METYCNPLPVAGVETGRTLDYLVTGLDYRNYPDYRSISDPSVIYYDGYWIMYPSYSVAYVSKDFVHWRHVDIGVHDLTYSPAVVRFRGSWYLLGHSFPEMYRADSPLGPFTLCGRLTDTEGKITNATDCCFLADGDRLYLYWVGYPPSDGLDVELLTSTFACELDPDCPWHMKTEPVILNSFEPSVRWQRHGEFNQNERMGWIEGQWAFKRGSRYYLLYSGSGTQFSAYANGILYSDEGPLSGFVRQRNHDPLTEKRTGLVRGAGHGSIAEGPNGTLWIFYTCVFNYYYDFERRVCMDPLGIDENGELYCPALTETPQYAPGVKEHPENGNDAGLLPLTFRLRPSASSEEPGRDALYASDDSVLTWWQPRKEDPEPQITFRLGSQTAYRVEALRIIWRDIGMDTAKGILPGAIRYVTEYSPDRENREWRPLTDENTEDFCIDYRTFAPVRAYAVRLRILGAPEGITPGLVSLTAFGKCAHEK